MAISFKTLTQNDRTQSRTLLHESIPITGTLVSGTYATASTGRGVNIKTFSHGMFQSVYDYPYASSSANHIFDITAGFSTKGSSVSGSTTSQASKKVNIYNQMAQVLAGYDTGSNIRRFDQDGDMSAGGGTKHDNAIFFNFSRLLVKDEIKKGSFSMNLSVSSSYAFATEQKIQIADTGAGSVYKINSPAGEYGILKATNLSHNVLSPLSGSPNTTADACGLIYYQAGVVVLTSSVFQGEGVGLTGMLSASCDMDGRGHTIGGLLTGSTIDAIADGVRHRIDNISFNNTTELNSSIFFCRANFKEFNYSSNPTYLSGSKIRVKSGTGTNEAMNQPFSYVTTVGLYSPDNELMAVAKLSEPLKKSPTNELVLRVRLDY